MHQTQFVDFDASHRLTATSALLRIPPVGQEEKLLHISARLWRINVECHSTKGLGVSTLRCQTGSEAVEWVWHLSRCISTCV